MPTCSRRGFFRTGLGTLATLGSTRLTACAKADQSPPADLPPPVDLPPPAPMTSTRALGRTGHDVRLFSLGGQAALETAGQEQLSEQIINRAIDLGVNYIDTSAFYGAGLSETSIGRVMATRRDAVFLATKTLARDHDESMRDLDQSLSRLQTDRIDLWQMHNLRLPSDLEAVFAPGGAIEAFEEAQLQGVTRFLGITGHFDPAVLTEALLRFPFDTVLMALNAADVHDKSFARGTLPDARAREMGVIAMKVAARGSVFQAGGVTTMDQALRYTLTHPVSTAIVGCSTLADVEANVRIANAFTPLSQQEMTATEQLTQPYHRTASFFKYDW